MSKISQILFTNTWSISGNVESPFSFTKKSHFSARIRWAQEVKNMMSDGVVYFHEFGPGEVLTGLIGKIRASMEG